MSPRNVNSDKGASSFESTEISLAVLLSSPITWKGSKCCNFFTSAWNGIKEDPTMKRFKIKLDKDHLHKNSDWTLWPRGSNWEEVVGKEHFKLLTTFTCAPYQKTGNVPKHKVNNTSVVKLLQIIRNKHQHNSSYSNEEKQKLNWFRKSELNGKWQFDESLFANYWTERFPQLLMYLWWQFRIFRDLKTEKDPEVQEFYPYPMESLNFDLMELPTLLQKATHAHLEQGMLDTRYKISAVSASTTLEFYQIKNELLNRILDGSFCVTITIDNHCVNCSWHKTTEHDESPGDSRVIRIKNANKIGSESVTILLANKISHLKESAVVKSVYDNNQRITIFTSEDHSNNAKEKEVENFMVQNCASVNGGNISEIPVKWDELGAQRQTQIRDKSRFKMGNNLYKVNDIMLTNNLFRHLNGNVLNQLLRGNTCHLFKKHKLPDKSEIYIERKLIKNVQVKTEAIVDNLNRAVFVVTNLSQYQLQKVLYNDQHERKLTANPCISIVLVNDLENLKEKIFNQTDSAMFLFKNSGHGINNQELIDYKIGNNNRTSIHVLHHLNGNTFEWLGNIGCHTNAKTNNHLPNTSQRWLEDEYLKNGKIDDKIIIIADKPGMGKSSVLASLVQKICANFTDRFVIHVTLPEFVNRLFCLGTTTKESVLTTIQHFICENEFERKLVENLLISNKTEVKFEIMLDALDEVSLDNRYKAIEAIKIINEEMNFVRIWVTLRDHLLDVPQEKFGSSGYKLEPFSKEKQVEFLEMYWSSKTSNDNNTFDLQEVRNFAKEIIKFPLSDVDADITGIPLQCRMLAEIYEKKVLKGDFSLNSDTSPSQVTLYENTMEKKFEIYLEEKKGLPSHILMNDREFNSLRINFFLLHVYFAIKLLFGVEYADRFKAVLFQTKTDINFLESTALKMGLIVSTNPIAFIHRTFAEYLVAWFIAGVMSNEFSQISKNSNLFQDFLWNEVFSIVPRVKDVLCFDDEDKIESRWERDLVYELKCPTIAHFHNAIWKERTSIEIQEKIEFFRKELRRLGLGSPYTFDYEKPFIESILRTGYNSIFHTLLNSKERLLYLFVEELEHNEYFRLQFCMDNNLCFGVHEWQALKRIDDLKFGILHWIVYGLFNAVAPKYEDTEKFINYIFQKDFSVTEQRDCKGRTPLLLFLQEGCLQGHEKLYEYVQNGLHHLFVYKLRADVNVRDDDNNTVLHVIQPNEGDNEIRGKYDSLLDAYIELWKYFMKNGCTGETMVVVNSDGNTPLLGAIKVFGDLMTKALYIFKDGGADFNAKDRNGDTSLHISIEKEFRLKFVNRIIECGADVTSVNGKGQTALHLAVEKGNNLDLVKMLIDECGAILELRDSNGQTVMEYQTTECVSKFLQNKCDALRKRLKRKKSGLKKIIGHFACQIFETL